ncbi:hypothetical protein RVR_5433 [Actinacidiphila reveromycinica]|uniref:Uncharacterized protein n=1 Tax=Actinacidiphila reveromycinica TaxID=659352 RepID=A0A7U3VPS9_9ACTN|nr:hypothetical protein [Streptomyces sp. SN-593]BBA98994.1 hypothetical protein RVR_5433 [Streptomyces sp. SN-593]
MTQDVPHDNEHELLGDALFAVISEAYYGERVRSGSSARMRAQAAQSTLTLFAGGLVATFTYAGLDDRQVPAQVAGIAAVVFWLLAAVLYLYAVAAPVKVLAGPQRVRSREALVEAVLQLTRDEADAVDGRQRWANRSSVAAMCATLLALGLGVLMEPQQETRAGTVAVEAGYRSQLSSLCPGTAATLRGQVDEQTVGKDFLSLSTSPGVCGRDAVELLIPRPAIRAISLVKD